MSTDAPWIALAIDFIDSDMFRVAPIPQSAVATTTPPEHRASHGEVLAWVCLLCWAKAFGRAGRVRVVKSDFANRFHLSMRSVEGMLSRAQKCAAVTCEGEYVTVCNWGTYQGKATSAKYRKSSSNSETSLTKDHTPSTKHHTHPPPPQGGADVSPGRKKRDPVRFSKPVVSEVAAYVSENGLNVDPQQFVDYYESVGWTVGKKPMKNWKAAASGWNSRNKTKDPASRIMTKEDAKNWTPE